MIPDKNKKLQEEQDKYNHSSVMQKQKIKNVKNIDLLERLKINSIQIDLIKNGTPLVLTNKKSSKIDLEEIKKIATQHLPQENNQKVEIIIRDKNELDEIKEECFDEASKKYNSILKGSREQ